jgi:glycerate 2-kinase
MRNGIENGERSLQLKIRNKDELLAYGVLDSRRIVVEITEQVLQKLDAYERLKALVRLEGNFLLVGNRHWDLTQKRHIYVFCAGKAANHMAKAMDEILGLRLTKGVAIVKIVEETDQYANTEVFVGGHPLPNYEGVRGCRRMLEIVDQANQDDLFIVCISGGSTALMAYPVDEITLEEKIAVTDTMLKSNIRVMDINVIRGHLSQMNRGRLGQRIEKRGAEIIGLNIWDALDWPPIKDYGEPVVMRGTPIGPDYSTFADAQRIILEHGLIGRLPKSVESYIFNGTEAQETPKSISHATYFMLNILSDSCRYASEIASERGINNMILTTSLEGESKDVGIVLAGIAKEVQNFHRPIVPPCMIFSAGETSTNIPDNREIKGHGGPSQELTAGFAIIAKEAPGVCILSIDTEGTDGTTKMAGGITDSETYRQAVSKGIDLQEAIRGHATYEALSKLGCCIFTGNTGTNLCDFNVLYIPEKQN